MASNQILLSPPQRPRRLLRRCLFRCLRHSRHRRRCLQAMRRLIRCAKTVRCQFRRPSCRQTTPTTRRMTAAPRSISRSSRFPRQSSRLCRSTIVRRSSIRSGRHRPRPTTRRIPLRQRPTLTLHSRYRRQSLLLLLLLLWLQQLLWLLLPMIRRHRCNHCRSCRGRCSVVSRWRRRRSIWPLVCRRQSKPSRAGSSKCRPSTSRR
jgi:hypothetical protein